jgi:hypothetical protein
MTIKGMCHRSLTTIPFMYAIHLMEQMGRHCNCRHSGYVVVGVDAVCPTEKNMCGQSVSKNNYDSFTMNLISAAAGDSNQFPTSIIPISPSLD